MTILIWVLVFFALICAGSVVFVLGRHWKEIQLLDPESIKEEREKQKRDEILLQRFDRIRAEKVAPLRAVGNRVIHAIKTRFHEVYIRLVRLERSYRQAKTPFAVMTPSTKDRLKLVLNEARSLARDLKWPEAERRYLEALGIDSHAWDAYKGLGQIYLKQDLLPQATETYEFLLKSKMAERIPLLPRRR
jgi:tetratricopeptide (TPR) repeat protein